MATHTLCSTKVSLSYTNRFYYSNQRKVHIRTLLSMNTEYKHYLAETLAELSIVLLFLWAAAAAASDTLSFCLSLFKRYSGLGCMRSLIHHISLNIQTNVLLVSGRNILSDKQPMWFHSLVILHCKLALGNITLFVLCPFLPGLGEALPLVLKHPEYVSEWGNGWCVRRDVDTTMGLVGKQRDLRTKQDEEWWHTGRLTRWQKQQKTAETINDNIKIKPDKIHQHVYIILQKRNIRMKMRNREVA